MLTKKRITEMFGDFGWKMGQMFYSDYWGVKHLIKNGALSVKQKPDK